MTNPTPLSPAAQAVANAIEPLNWESGHCTYEDIRFISREVAVAALRAVADLVIPENYECFTGTSDWDLGSEARNDAIRDELLAIAAELEGAQ